MSAVLYTVFLPETGPGTQFGRGEALASRDRKMGEYDVTESQEARIPAEKSREHFQN